jgi:hypothetical protein
MKYGIVQVKSPPNQVRVIMDLGPLDEPSVLDVDLEEG